MLGVPPIARRTAISCRRRATRYASRLYRPIAVRAMAAAPKAPSSQVLKRRAAVWIVDQLFQRRDPCERLIRIQLANHRTKRGRDRSRFSSSANDDGHRPRVLGVRLI